MPSRHRSTVCLLLAIVILLASPLLVLAAEAESDGQPPVPWMERVDGFFGDLVQGLATVLFYDFGTDVPFIVFWLLAGAVYFTIRMSFINIRAFWLAIRLTKGDFDNPEDEGEVSHFQALSSALSATVGLGNIAGVAIAVGVGGPGAIFWMIVAGLLGMSTKFTECTLGQMYRKVSEDGTVSGGPMHYLKDGLKELGLGPLGVVLAVLYAFVCMGASFGGGCAFQVNQSLGPIKEQLGFLNGREWIYGLVMVALVGVVIVGGIRRIAATASKIVPLMCAIYVLSALYILAINYDRIPAAISVIFSEAFRWDSVYGGFLGVMVQGIRRAVFSNEAGIGSASIAHSAAKADHPASEGIVALLEPFIDTVVVCTMTGLVIVILGFFKSPESGTRVERYEEGAIPASMNITDIDWEPSAEIRGDFQAKLLNRLESDEFKLRLRQGMAEGGNTEMRYIIEDAKTILDEQSEKDARYEALTEPQRDKLARVAAKEAELMFLIDNDGGAALTSRAFGSAISWFPYILSTAVFLFAYSTMISWSYYGERCWSYLFGTRTSFIYKILFLVFVFLGAVVTATNVKDFADLMILSLAFPNILGVVLLSGKVRRTLDEYWGRYQSGEMKPVDKK